MKNANIIVTKADLIDQDSQEHILEIQAKFDDDGELKHHIIDTKGYPFTDHGGQELVIHNDDIPNLIELLQMMHNDNV